MSSPQITRILGLFVLDAMSRFLCVAGAAPPPRRDDPLVARRLQLAFGLADLRPPRPKIQLAERPKAATLEAWRRQIRNSMNGPGQPDKVSHPDVGSHLANER